jgi:hypothetical protein
MKIAICWFTCVRDNSLVRISAKSFQLLGKTSLDVEFDYYFCVDRAEIGKGFSDVDGATTISTTFARKSNLNGIECVVGELTTLRSIAEISGVDWVLKVDSDILVTNGNWLDYLTDEWAFVGGNHNYIYAWGAAGGAYLINAKALAQLEDIEALVTEANLFRYGKLDPIWAEDEVVSAVFESAFPDHTLYVADSYPKAGWLTRHKYDDEKQWWKSYCFTEFGGHQDEINWTDDPHWSSPKNTAAIAKIMRSKLQEMERNEAPEFPDIIVNRNARPYFGVYNDVNHYEFFGPLIQHATRQGRFIQYMGRGDQNRLPAVLAPCDIVAVWNGLGLRYSQVMQACQDMGKKVIIVESGYFPQASHATFDRQGFMTGSTLMDDDLAWVTPEMLNRLAKFRLKYAPKWEPPGGYVLVPLQLEDDSNFVGSCEFSTMQEFIDSCCEVHRGKQILFKRHPKDGASYNTYEHSLVTNGELKITNGARYASEVYGVSSTALLECALIEGLPVTAIGKSFLNKPQARDRVLAALLHTQVHKHAIQMPELVLKRINLTKL